MMRNLTALLCLGMSVGPRTLEQTGTNPKPELLAKPGSVMSLGGTVDLWCKWTLGAQQCNLFKEGSSVPWRTQTFEMPANAAQFSIPSVTEHDAGRYHCCYRTSAGWSEPSVPLLLEVTGALRKASFWAEPHRMIPRGKPVVLRCEGTVAAQEYYLDKEEWPEVWNRQTSAESSNGINFSIPSMTAENTGRYRCRYSAQAVWSQLSETLELVMTGVYSKPSLAALPNAMVTSGGNITLRCGSQRGFDRFILTEEGGDKRSWTLDSQHNSGNVQALFTVGPVIPNHNWTLRCYGYEKKNTQMWSEPSDALQLLISGHLLATPSLSVHPGPRVSSGENVTLLCQSQSPMDSFLLYKEGAADPPLRLKSESQGHQSQAEFSMGAASSALRGTYRCYGSLNSTPYLLSQPSDAVELEVSGLARYLHVLIGVLLASVLLLLILFLFLVLQHKCQNKNTKADATVKDTQPEDRVELDALSPPHDDPQEVMYTQVKLSAPSRPMDTQAAAHEDPQDVTYAQLCSTTLRQGTAAPPSSQDRVLPVEPSVYAVLSSTRPGAVPK